MQCFFLCVCVLMGWAVVACSAEEPTECRHCALFLAWLILVGVMGKWSKTSTRGH